MESTTPQAEEPTQEQPQQQEHVSPEKQVADEKQQETPAETQEKVSRTSQESQESTTPAKEEPSASTDAAVQEPQQTPAKTVTPEAKTPSDAPKSATKRKFDALHALKAETEPTIYEHEKNKQARASALMTAPTAKRSKREPREFSFARPTASSASRTAAIASAHSKATPPPTRQPSHSKPTKRTPLRTPQRSSTPAPKTPATTGAENKRHFNYTPYSGPLPPLTVESSFAPKNSQILDRGARTASPAPAKNARRNHPTPAKVRNTAGKENVATNLDRLAADEALDSNTLESTGPPASKETSNVGKEQVGMVLEPTA
ncbi:hypothetical protein PHYBOEH_005920 [Phytophthora boehmeriae]|uniref:Uncharacterized protein n=1 Tax=Phytophthora boehmeriae TaxID=109152 RepID=A0A8T1WJ91_9STRA|nr:hypothetical protein PHYBOEH_005920 [Phytophthora boehmeriae]